MIKNTRIFSLLILLSLVVSTPSAYAQGLDQQGYTYYPNNNQGYNQQYNQQPNQPYNQNYNQNYQNYNQYSPVNNQQQQLQPLQGQVAVAPAGTSLNVSTTSSLSSDVSRVGDTFTTRLSSDLYSAGGLVLPAGSVIEGQVTEVEKAGRLGKNGLIAVRFTNVITPNGQRIPIYARLLTQDGSGVIKGGSTIGRVGKSALNTAIGAGVGAALGTALAPAAGGSVGKGAVYGTAIGGGAGLLSNLARKGAQALLPSGTELQIQLEQNLAVPGSSGAPSGNNYPSYPSSSY